MAKAKKHRLTLGIKAPRRKQLIEWIEKQDVRTLLTYYRHGPRYNDIFIDKEASNVFAARLAHFEQKHHTSWPAISKSVGWKSEEAPEHVAGPPSDPDHSKS